METKTYVFFDLETTGLPQFENGTRITEISLVAASRDQIADKHNGVTKENNISNDFLPRVLNKINLTVYPCKMIQPRASEITGLTNENLEVQHPFDEDLFKLIVHFMERLEKPICLVAHNGNKFDFPILQSELSKINKELPDDLYCADTLLGFREVLARPLNSEENAISGIKPLNDTNTKKAASLVPKCGWSCEEYDQELDQVTELAERFTQEDNSLDSDKLDRKIQAEMQRMRAVNEKTPQRKSRKSDTCQQINLPNVRRKILNDQQPRRKFDLKSVYESTTNREFVNCHRAEADALALLECVTAVGRPILEWMDSKRIPFKSIKKIW
uniref:Exonuclease domain-containing protein n=1 Tax=Cuerna arida TaxID=1464854 RepID=A0A1B6FXI8_9HEMI